MATLIMSVLLVAGLQMFANLGASQGAMVNREEAAFLVVNLAEEINKRNYDDPEASGAIGTDVGEALDTRSDFDDIDDYDGWSANPPQDRQGNTYDQYPNLARSVSVQHVQANDFTQTAAGDEGFKQVTITITGTNGAMLEERKFVLADVEW